MKNNNAIVTGGVDPYALKILARQMVEKFIEEKKEEVRDEKISH